MASPAETMFDVLIGQSCLPEHIKRQKLKPGVTFQSLPQETRDTLSKLTADDLNSIRPDLIKMVMWTREDSERERLSKLLTDFDEKMNNGKGTCI